MENRLNSNDAAFDLSSDDEDDEKAFSQVNILKIIHLVQKS